PRIGSPRSPDCLAKWGSAALVRPSLEERRDVGKAVIRCCRERSRKTTLVEISSTLGSDETVTPRAAASRELLAPVYGWFTEGFDTHGQAGYVDQPRRSVDISSFITNRSDCCRQR